MNAVYERMAALLSGTQTCPTCGHAEATASQADIALALDIDPASVSRMKSGKAQPNIQHVRRLAKATGKRPSEVMAALWPEDEAADV